MNTIFGVLETCVGCSHGQKKSTFPGCVACFNKQKTDDWFPLFVKNTAEAAIE